jgi:Flp pilus assembly protein TadG
MLPRKAVSHRRRKKSGGNAMVEWAFVLLPTMALLTAFTDLSLALFSWSTLQNAVREGCRYAITYQTGVVTGQGQDANILMVVQQNSMGLVKASGSPKMIFVDYFVQNVATGAITATSSNAPGTIVQVSVQGYPLSWLAPISGTLVNPLRPQSPTSIAVYSSDVMGGYPAGMSSVAR